MEQHLSVTKLYYKQKPFTVGQIKIILLLLSADCLSVFNLSIFLLHDTWEVFLVFQGTTFITLMVILP